MTQAAVESEGAEVMLNGSVPLQDVDEAARFSDLMHGAGAQPTFQIYRDHPGATGQAQVLTGSFESLKPLLVGANQAGCAVAITVNKTDGKGRKNENVTGVNALVIDGDGLSLDAIRNCPVQPHAVVESSPGNHHAYWLVVDCSREVFSQVQDALADHFGVNSSVKDLAHPMRMPGFLHQKDPSHPFLSRIIQGVGDPSRPRYTLREIIDGLGLVPRSAKEQPPTAGNGDDEDPELEWLVDIQAGENLHDSTLRLAASLVSQGLVGGGAVRHIRNLLKASTAPRNQRWRDRYKDVPRLVRDAQSGGFALTGDRPSAEHGKQVAEAILAKAAAEAKANEPRFKLLNGNDIRALPWLRWRVRGVLPEVGLAVIFGPTGSGKSFLAFDLAAAIAEGRQWFGHRVEGAPVAYMVLEGEGGIRQRAAAWEGHYGRPLPNAMGVVLQPFKITDAQDIADLVEVVPKGAVVFVDTLNRAAPGKNENAPDDMGMILEGSKQLQTATGGLVVLVHHTGKDVERGMRGHTSLPAAADAGIEVSRSGDRRAWTAQKVKDGEDGEQRGFRLETIMVAEDEYGDPITSCVVIPEEEEASDTPAGAKSEPPYKNQKIALTALRLVLPLPDSGSRVAVSYEEALSVAAAAMTCDSSHRKDYARAAITGLIKGGYLRRDGDEISINYAGGSS